MLDRSRCVKAVQSADFHQPFNLKRSTLERMSLILHQLRGDVSLQKKLLPCTAPLTWRGDFTEPVQLLSSHQKPYRAIGIDGSQVYPDSHQGSSATLINIGIADIFYSEISKAHLFTEPFVYHVSYKPCKTLERSAYVDLLRTVHEVRTAHTLSQSSSLSERAQTVFLFDGTLSYYGYNTTPLAHDLAQIYTALEGEGVRYAAYHSMPTSTLLVDILFKAAELLGSPLDILGRDFVVDADVLPLFIPVGFRTPLFVTAQQILVTFLHTPYELVRLEMPFSFFADQEALNFVLYVVTDQVQKGYGYPVVLSEAHEQAVIREQDKLFFMQVCADLVPAVQQTLRNSQKYLKKRIRYV